MPTLRFDNGDMMPMLGLGTWKSAPGEVREAVKEAVRLGYRHIDCAPVYGNEPEIGEALVASFEAGVVTRDEMWITSKLWNHSHVPSDVRPAIEKTLADLRLDTLDLYLIHWPVAHRKDVVYPQAADELVDLDEVPITATWKAMEDLIEGGLTRHAGVSNFSATKLKTLVSSARRKPEMNQVELHPYLQQRDLLAFCASNGIHLTAYSPLGAPDRPSGLKATDEPILLNDPTIVEIAARRSATPAQVLISWAIHRGTAVIPKSVNPQRLAQNFDSANVKLEEQDMRDIAALDRHRRYVTGKFWALQGGPYTVASLWDE